MKIKSLLFFVLLFAGHQASAAQLFCGFDGFEDETSHEYRLIYKSVFKGHCTTASVEDAMAGKKSPEFDFEISGVGPGLEASIVSGSMLTCPTARIKHLTDRDFYGIEVGASAMFGAEAGVFMNSHLGACVITGLKMGFGAGASIGKLSFSKSY